MHDIWNPWHGCIKVSEGCKHCYMYFLDKKREMDGSKIFKTKSSFNYPLAKDRNGNYKIKSGELIRVCMTSDFFLEEADEWRNKAWSMMKQRSDVKFFLLTKRPERVKDHLPLDWGDGYDNVFFNVTCENQERANERIPILLSLPFKHKGIMVAPFIGPINIEKFLSLNQIEQVVCGGENYDGSRICDFEWVQSLSNQCRKYNITFCFIEIGNKFKKGNKIYNIQSKKVQAEMAFKSNISFHGREINFILKDQFGDILPENLYIPSYKEHCQTCGSKMICNGCSSCGKCK